MLLNFDLYDFPPYEGFISINTYRDMILIVRRKNSDWLTRKYLYELGTSQCCLDGGGRGPRTTPSTKSSCPIGVKPEHIHKAINQSLATCMVFF